MNVRLATIGDYVKPVATWVPSSKPQDRFLYIDLSAVSQTEKKITESASILGSEAPSRARQIIENGDVLVSTVRPNLNGVAPVTAEFDGATASTGFCVLRPRHDKLLSNYLMHWVRSPRFIELMVRQATGASYPAVTDRIVKGSLIPLPPLDEQRRIATILDKADDLRRKRKRALELLDGLTQSIFLEMFGRPGDPNAKVAQRPLGELAEFINGDRSSNYPSGDDILASGVLFLNTTNITPDGLDIRSANYISEEKFETLSRGKLKLNDIIITLRGSLGQTAIFENAGETGFINAQMMIVRPKKEINPRYLLQVLQLDEMRAHFKRIGSGSAVPQLTAKQMSEIAIPLPDLAAQKYFGYRREAIQKIRKVVAHQLHQLNDLFLSLQHRAFSGQL